MLWAIIPSVTKSLNYFILTKILPSQFNLFTDQDYDSIGILFIGNYNKNPPKPTLISKLLDEFLPYAINLAKLEPDYKIFAQRQCIANITSPGDSFFEIMKKWPHFDPEKQPTICQFGCITG